jgi:hypothetical protein
MAFVFSLTGEEKSVTMQKWSDLCRERRREGSAAWSGQGSSCWKTTGNTSGFLLKRPAPRIECPVCGTGPCNIANPDRARTKRPKGNKNDARIGDLAIGRYRIDLPIAHLKCVEIRKILK